MSKNKKDSRYDEVEGKLQNIDEKLMKTISELEKLTKILIENPEVCPDERASEKALQNALDAYFADELLKQEPIGEA